VEKKKRPPKKSESTKISPFLSVKQHKKTDEKEKDAM